MISLLDCCYPLLRPLLFSLNPEKSHDLTLRLLARSPTALGSLLQALHGPIPAKLERTVMGLPFKSPIGLAAGLDKDGIALPFWPSLGFGFVEIGTVTALAQPGNPAPRLFRYPQQGALINRMGFNNQGSAALADRLRKMKQHNRWPSIPVGVNIGKSKVTPIEEAVQDYVTSATRLAHLADYITINVSSPNTPDLRSLQQEEHLKRLLPAVLKAAQGTPVALKLSPDLQEEALATIVELACSLQLGAIIATNTTTSRTGLPAAKEEAGGLSGRPLWPRSSRVVLKTLEFARQRVPIIGVGGIETAAQVQQLLDAGCAAIQLYSAFIFHGPGLPARLAQQLAQQTDHNS